MRLRLAVALPAILALAACSSQPRARIGGDAGGVPVLVRVTYDREALDGLTDGGAYQRTLVYGSPFWSGPYVGGYRCRPYGYPFGYGPGWYGSMSTTWGPYEPTTRLSLLIGHGPGEAQLLRATLVSGTWEWTIPMDPAREVHVAIQASGGRSGWTDLGAVTVTSNAILDVDLSGVAPVLRTLDGASGG